MNKGERHSQKGTGPCKDTEVGHKGDLEARSYYSILGARSTQQEQIKLRSNMIQFVSQKDPSKYILRTIQLVCYLMGKSVWGNLVKGNNPKRKQRPFV